MKYKIKNLTGDPTNADSRFWQGQKFYATSDKYQSLLPIGPQETVIVGENAFVELTQNSNYAMFFQIIDAGGDGDTDVPYRMTITLNNTWQYIDLGRFAANITITNPDATNSLLFSFSGFTSPLTQPAPATQSTVLKGESISISEPMNPIRFIYIKGAGATAYILSA